jgi:Dullard-like phosphatase family protein
MVCYDFSFGNNVDDEDLNLSLTELIYFNHNNLIIICEYILNKIAIENTDNIWVLKLKEIVKNSTITQPKEFMKLSPIQKISNNTNKIIKKIKSILLNYQSDSSSLLKNYILYLPQKSYSEINTFFRSQILRINNYEGSSVPPSHFQENEEFIPIQAPYLQYPSSKPYTLILDLDETLVSFQLKSKKEGTLRARPFLFAFLEEMGHYYELIVWTSATESYANSLVEAIEYDKQYFDFILFREHAIIIGDEFVKDLNRVGRGLDRIIIVDDMPQNFRLQKQNGITIKPFYGDDYNDTALYDLLPILKHIAEEGNDVRIELAKYREEIVRKITSNISLKDI